MKPATSYELSGRELLKYRLCHLIKIGLTEYDVDMTTPNTFWQSVIQWTVSLGGKFNFMKFLPEGHEVPRPEGCNFLKKHIGELKGQIADWRASFNDSESGFHAVEFGDRYECHIDKRDPFKDPIGHLIEDSPGTLFAVGLVAIGALLLYTFSRK